MSTVGRALKKFSAFLFKSAVVLLFCIFGLWLLKLVYFPQLEIKESAVAAPSSETAAIPVSACVAVTGASRPQPAMKG